MCQAKSKGGKRCAIHHAGTQAAIKTVSIETNVPQENVKEIFQELNKEGKKLDAPSRAEYLEYIEKERFMVDINPNLSERDKRMLLKRYTKAEVENTPAGGTFHAWKNLMKTTLQRYGKAFRKAGIAVGIIGSLTLTACSGSGGVVNSNTAPTKNPSESSIVVEGDIITNGKVTDEYGEYIATKLDPKSSLYTLNEGIVNKEALEANGFTMADAESAQKWVLDFVSSEGVDSIALDNPAGWEKWKSEIANKYFDPEWSSSLLDDSEGYPSYVTLNNLEIKTVRDGKTRITKQDISVNSIDVFSEDKPYIDVYGKSIINYRATEKDAIKMIINRDSSYTEAKIKEKWPSLFDGKEETYQVTMDWNYSLEKQPDGSFKLAGYYNSYNKDLLF